MSELEKRAQRLEKTNRALTLIILAASGLALFVAAKPAKKPPPVSQKGGTAKSIVADFVQTKQLIITDDKGLMRATFSCDEDGPSIALFDKDHNLQLSIMCLDANGMAIVALNCRGIDVAAKVRKPGGVANLSSRDAGLELISHSTGSIMLLRDENDETPVAISRSADTGESKILVLKKDGTKAWASP